MNNKKNLIGIMVIVVAVIIAGIIIWKFNEKKSENSKLRASSRLEETDNLKNKFSISDEWTLVSHDNFWNNPNIFSNSNYKFPNIKFSYPDNWDFQCCGDTDYGSTHIIYSSKEKNKALPYVRIISFSLNGCPDSQKNCSLDKTIKISANEKFNNLISVIPSADILPKVKLNNLNVNILAYKKSEENGRLSRGYIINIKDSVVEIAFVNYELLGDAFIENFLSRIFLETN
jgi:hypothetical protein